MDMGVSNIEVALQKEFPEWFKNHVRKLENPPEDLVSLANGPDKRVLVYSACNIKGARFQTVAREKNQKTQNSGVMTKVDITAENDSEFYGVLKEVLELQYGNNKNGDRSVFLFRCDWFDLQSKGCKLKDDGFFRSVNTSKLWYQSAPFILARQAETCFYLDDTTFGDPWKVVQTYRNRDVYDVPEKELGLEGADEQAGYAYQEDIGEMDHVILHHEVEDEMEVQADDREDEPEEVDARIVRQLSRKDKSTYIEVSEDEQVDAEEGEPDFLGTASDCDTDDE